MQGVVKMFDPLTNEGVLVSEMASGLEVLIGVINDPPPTPVIPTRKPTKNPENM